MEADLGDGVVAVDVVDIVELLKSRNDEKILLSFFRNGADANDKIDLLCFCGVTQFELELGISGTDSLASRFSNDTPVCSNTVLSQLTINLLRNVFGRF